MKYIYWGGDKRTQLIPSIYVGSCLVNTLCVLNTKRNNKNKNNTETLCMCKVNHLIAQLKVSFFLINLIVIIKERKKIVRIEWC